MNIGFTDRIMRLSAGLGVVFFDYLSSASWEIIFVLVGSWSVLTSVFGWCPFYRVMGVNTCPQTFKMNEEQLSENIKNNV